MLTMLLGGLWHGAAWTFVFWGALHGIYQVLERFVRATPKFLFQKAGTDKEAFAELNLKIKRYTSPIWWLVTLILVMVAWVPFRAADFDDSTSILKAMFGGESYNFSELKNDTDLLMLVSFAALLVFSVLNRKHNFFVYWRKMPSVLRGVLLGIMLVGILSWRGEPNEFIYFQF